MNQKTTSELAATFIAAMEIWDGMKRDGVPVEERIAGLEKTLRAAWPFTREWKYLCARCSDYGLVYAECPGDATCGRSKEHLAHEFGTPCWCDAGKKFKPKQRASEDFIEEAGRTRKPTRLGRR